MNKKVMKYYASFYEVSKELDQKQFYEFNNAIFSVMFYEQHINDVEFKDKMLSMLWLSIKHSLQSSIDGYCYKQKLVYEDTLSKGVSKGVVKGVSKGLGNNDNDNDNDKDKDKGKVNIAFEKFWDNYPKKINKKLSMVAFGKLGKVDAKLATEDCKVRFVETEKQYIPNPMTYLNGERWNDELDDGLAQEKKGYYGGVKWQ
jgi:hypothetical protein